MPPSTDGQWLGATQTPGDSHMTGDGDGVFVIHATLLRNGKVLWFSGHAETVHYLAESWIWDPSQPIATAVKQPFPASDDIFCCHHAVLDDGRVITVGGAAAVHGTGIKAICVLDPAAAVPSWTKIGEMAHGRWYPTLVTLPDGRLVVFSGRREASVGGISDTVELLSPPFTGPGYTTDTLAGGDKLYPTYPGLHLVRGGRIFHTGPTWQYELGATAPIGTWSFRLTGPTTAEWTDHATSPDADFRQEAMSVLLPPAQDGKLLVVGGGPVASSEPRAAEILDTQSTPPSWTRIADMNFPRINVHTVLLPDGKVLVLGGHDKFKWDATSVNSNQAEIYDPVADTWTLAATMSESRTYHSTALLLPNGSVIAAGGVDPTQAEPGHPGSALNRKTFEVYQPPYFFNGTRPQIVSVTAADVPAGQLAYGGTVSIEVDVAATDIAKVVLMRPGSTTHHTDTEQRYVPLDFIVTGANTLQAAVIADPSVAPPGYYMLWVVDTSNRPSQEARFIRLMRQQCLVIVDKTHYSVDELATAASTAFTESFYVVMDGFTPAELGLPDGVVPTLAQIVAAAPAVTFHRADTSAIATMSAAVTALFLEVTPPPAAVRQRFTFKYTLTFADRSAFFQADGTTPIELQPVTIQGTKGGYTGRGIATLIHQQNPYMIDGPTSWLSVDLRVFKLVESASMFGRSVGTTPATAISFLQGVLGDFNTNPAAARPQFESIPPEQNTPVTLLDILEERGGDKLFNFAIAQVRYRGRTLTATDVRVFFRAFTTAATGMDYQTGTYPTLPNLMGEPIALLGLQGGEAATIPFFAEERVDSSVQALTEQRDVTNVRTLLPNAAGNEITAYFGCWLDFNQTITRYPLAPGNSVGPWASGLLSLQDHIRGKHQCLVAEIHFPAGDPIPIGATPGGNDNLSQRNLAIDESDNPGGPASHTVQHTFEVRPSANRVARTPATDPALFVRGDQEDPDAPPRLLTGDGCDELMFLWGNLPRKSRVTLYMPGCDIDHILEVAAARTGPLRLEKVDGDTILLHTGDVTFVPLPSGRATNIPGLLTIQLPDGVRKKQEFRVVVRQFDAARRAIIGTFELRIPVHHAPEILRGQQETLAVMKHIALSIPQGNRWHPVFGRYVAQLGEKVRALGGDPDLVQPSTDDSGVPAATTPDGTKDRCRRLKWAAAALLVLAIVLLALARVPLLLLFAIVFVLLSALVFAVWNCECCKDVPPRG